MTKQEEVLKALTREMRDLKGRDYNEVWASEWILEILDTLGVVLKVDRDITEYSWDEWKGDFEKGLIKCSLVEPLIKEKRNE